MKKNVAHPTAKMVFYGMRQIYGGAGGYYRYRRYFVAVEAPETVVEVTIDLPDYHWEQKNPINLNAAMNKLAKRYFPKAETFMFYNRVSSRGILPPKPEPKAKSTFSVHKRFPNSK